MKSCQGCSSGRRDRVGSASVEVSELIVQARVQRRVETGVAGGRRRGLARPAARGHDDADERRGGDEVRETATRDG